MVAKSCRASPIRGNGYLMLCCDRRMEYSMYASHKRRLKVKGVAKGSKRGLYMLFASLSILLCLLLSVRFIVDYGATQSKPRAAIVDGLLHYPNYTFVEEATRILSSAGFEVDYIGYEEVTVEFYRRLPSLGYEFLVIRVHCGPLVRRLPNGTAVPGDDAVLFTAEEYDPDRHVEYQMNRWLAVARISGIPDEPYFAVPPWFFDWCAEGRFKDTVVVLDSCYGFYSLSMAEAFVRRGAKVFMGWDGEVQADHTDSAVIALLRAFCTEGLTVEQSVKRVMEEVGPDPYYGGAMLFYPSEAGAYSLGR